MSITRLPKLEKIKTRAQNTLKHASNESSKLIKSKQSNHVDDSGPKFNAPRIRKNKKYAKIASSGYGSFSVNNNPTDNSNNTKLRRSKRNQKRNKDEKSPKLNMKVQTRVYLP